MTPANPDGRRPGTPDRGKARKRVDGRAPALRVQHLASHLLGDSPDEALASDIITWLDRSAPFLAFAERHRDKIRKKLRGAGDLDARLDVRAEIRVAQLLLEDRRIDVAFEAYGSRQVGPDLTVSLHGERPFNIEVTRLRRLPDSVAVGGAIVAKLRQLPPSVPNVVLIAVDADDARSIDVAAAVLELRALADHRDEAFLARARIESGRAFYDRFLRLGAVLIWCERAGGEGRANAWVNGSARIVVPPRALRACLACLRVG
jgi:hypothetical protein